MIGSGSIYTNTFENGLDAIKALLGVNIDYKL
jgi:hypothetical protein